MKTFKLFIVVLVLGMTIPYVQPAFAQQASGDNMLCQRINIASQNSQNSMSSRRTPASTRPNVSTTEAGKYEQIRNRADALRKRHFDTIIAKLKNNQQKEALKKYQSDLEAAIIKRRESISSTQKQFIDSALELQTIHRTEVTKLELEFSDQVTTAFNTAKSSCADGENSQLVRQQLLSDIQLAKQTFGKSKLKLAQNGQKYRQLLQTRNQAITEALNEFKQSELRAKQELVAAIQASQ